MIEFHLDTHSGLAAYLQIVQQVQRALRLGLLAEGDQLPTVRDVVSRLAINPNTVLKAYRELEHQGVAAPRAGIGTFVTRSFSDASPAVLGPLRIDLERWLAKARRAGLDDQSVEALFWDTMHTASARGLSRDRGPRRSGPRQTVRSHLGAVRLRPRDPRRTGRRARRAQRSRQDDIPAPGRGPAGPDHRHHRGPRRQRPAQSPGQLAQVGFVAQDSPTYAGLSVADHLHLGAWLNPGWDDEMADAAIGSLGLDPRKKAGKLSGGQRAQLALTLAIAKRPRLLLLDEPVASLDPLRGATSSGSSWTRSPSRS